MYWDTLGPRWPLYADISDGFVSQEMRGDGSDDSSDVVECIESLGGEFRSCGDSRVEEEWVSIRRACFKSDILMDSKCLEYSGSRDSMVSA
jgi:hypothetical protein